ncbi:MAG: hypothetical protein OEX02_15350 [Cyclobacteriaceae bacterium]|nr:hypothetical protein [Cyclobacteriaceae bacterium]
MRSLIMAFAIAVLVGTSCIAQDDFSAQIAGALLAAPEADREGATVLGHKDGEIIVVREGTNNVVCLADDPAREGFNAACYHKDLEPFMARGRQLRKEGKNNSEIFQTREEEVKSGKLKIPSNTTLHILSGDDYDAEKGEVVNGHLRWVIYIPYATPESTGLPLAPPTPGAPWIMDPGTHRAHIMITPPGK